MDIDPREIQDEQDSELEKLTEDEAGDCEYSSIIVIVN
jgi:hypothetical protein